MDNNPYQYYPNQSGNANAGYVPPSGIYGMPEAAPSGQMPMNPNPYGQQFISGYANPYDQQPAAPEYPGYSPQGMAGYQQPALESQPPYQQPEFNPPASYQQPADYGQAQYGVEQQSRPSFNYTVTSGQGQSMILDNAIVVGRRPEVATSSYPQAQAMTVPSPAKQISRSHCLLYIDGGGNPSLKDLESVNGTRLRRDGQTHAIDPACPIVLQPGDIVDLGEGQYLSIGTAPAGY